MSLKDLDIKFEYNTLIEDSIQKFYNPCLSQAKVYQRVTAYFSSAILSQLTYGLSNLIKNNGTMELVISHKIDPSEYDAIKNGYENRELKLMSDMINIDKLSDETIERFGLLSYLIQKKVLEIKIAFIVKTSDDNISPNGILHTKTGIFKDSEGNVVTFIGSANETYQAYNLNHELFDVYCSWKSEESNSRCLSKINMFQRLWNDKEESVKVIAFPEVLKEKLFKCYDSNKVEKYLNLDSIQLSNYINRRKDDNRKQDYLTNSNLRDYQLEAIDLWVNNNYNGILNMATGTGKTFTALGAINALTERKKRKITIIVAPFKHLVDQWSNETNKFGFDNLKCYGNFKDYHKKIEDIFRQFKLNMIDEYCILITNVSFSNPQLQKLFSQNANSIFLIIDEAHNFGAYKLSTCLEINYKYRLALSATIIRHNDEYGTKKLFDYFDKVIFTYTLEEAIKNKMLTPYKYFPIIVHLNEEEQEEYNRLTMEIRRCFSLRGKKEDNKSSQLDILLVRRARVVAGAREKVAKLIDVMKQKEFNKEHNMLIYCGAINYEARDSIEKEEENQINEVINRLKKEIDIDSTRFTSKEKNDERKAIIKAFENKETQALVAIKCLDEGVNIPAINKAFILASSTNPKEYIQRKGRVLRLYKDKEFAEIYDFITLPRPLNEVYRIDEFQKKIDYTLIKKEFQRLKNFNESSMDSSSAERLMIDIINEYEIIETMEDEENEY